MLIHIYHKQVSYFGAYSDHVYRDIKSKVWMTDNALPFLQAAKSLEDINTLYKASKEATTASQPGSGKVNKTQLQFSLN